MQACTGNNQQGQNIDCKPSKLPGERRQNNEKENVRLHVSTHFSNFVFDMMSSFQLTKISPISPSVRQPESAIGFWKTCSQKMSISSENRKSSASCLAQQWLFLDYSVSNFSSVKSNSLLTLVTAVSPERVTPFWHRHQPLQSKDKHWDLQADSSAEEHSCDCRVNHCTNYTQALLLSPDPEHSGSPCVQNHSCSQGLSAPLWLGCSTSATSPHHCSVQRGQAGHSRAVNAGLSLPCQGRWRSCFQKSTGDKAGDMLLWCFYSSVQLCLTAGSSPSSFYWAQTPKNRIWKTGRSL